MTGALTVLSFNVHHGVGPDGRLDLGRVAELIRSSGADVVGLQEVDRHFGARSAGADQPAELAALLGMRVVFAANLDLEPATAGTPRREYGTAILSRHPIAWWRSTPLPKARPAEEQRGLLEVVLTVRGRPVRVMTTHLEWESAAARRVQARVVADAARASTEPVVLTGDLNATPDAPEITPLTPGLLVDSHAVAGHGTGATFPAEAPAVRIDYVLAGPTVRPLRSQVLPTRASDHHPVLATLLIERPG